MTDFRFTINEHYMWPGGIPAPALLNHLASQLSNQHSLLLPQPLGSQEHNGFTSPSSTRCYHTLVHDDAPGISLDPTFQETSSYCCCPAKAMDHHRQGRSCTHHHTDRHHHEPSRSDPIRGTQLSDGRVHLVPIQQWHDYHHSLCSTPCSNFRLRHAKGCIFGL